MTHRDIVANIKKAINRYYTIDSFEEISKFYDGYGGL